MASGVGKQTVNTICFTSNNYIKGEFDEGSNSSDYRNNFIFKGQLLIITEANLELPKAGGYLYYIISKFGRLPPRKRVRHHPKFVKKYYIRLKNKLTYLII
ncbi:hypothetical protein GCM10008905_08380 [Clostridium malenominatum]|uniref:Uncharacterized protein n=1 Tax=Clostridium malenominatum TaxID=1539 RepID=A0ABN1IRY8_9CLOT